MPLTLADRATTAPPSPLLTSREARALAIDVSTDAYVRVRRGVYAAAVDVRRLRPWQRYALRVHAFIVTHPGAIVCLESAAVLHGLPTFGETRDVHVYDPSRTTSTRYGDVVVHTGADARSLALIEGIPVTSLTDTVADLTRVLPPAQALSVIDAAISPVQGGSLDPSAVLDLVMTQTNGRGRRRAIDAVRASDSRAESVGESVSRAVIGWCGFDVPELQCEFRYEGATDRADFHFRSSRTIGESDGWGKYSLSDAREAERHLRAEKRREDRLRRHGHPFARWDLSDALRVEPLRRALAAASVPLSRSPDRAALATLRRSPRLL